MNRIQSLIFIFSLLLLPSYGAINHAVTADIKADSIFSPDFNERFIADGVIPRLGDHHAKEGEWAVFGKSHGKGALLTFTWKKPVKISEVVYYGRSSPQIEGWKGFGIFADNRKKAVKEGELLSGYGPQRIILPEPIHARKLCIRFTSSHGGANPGASEIQIFDSAPSPKELIGQFRPLRPFMSRENRAAYLKSLEVKDDPGLKKSLNEGKLGFNRFLVVQRHPYNLSHVYVPHAESFQPGGGIYIYTPGAGEKKLQKIFDSTVGEVMDLALSYDGKEILFSWKERDTSIPNQKSRNLWSGPILSPETKYHIYRMSLDSATASGVSKPRQLTFGSSNNFNPCWLPDGGIAFLSDRKRSYAYCFVTTSPLVHRMEADGSNPRRLSHGYLNDFTPAVLNDGRIIYGRWEYVDRPAIPAQGLWTLHPDGTALTGYFGNRCIEPGTFMEARSIGTTRKVLCVLTGHNGSCRGALGVVDTRFGPNAQEGIRNITPEIPLLAVNDCSQMGNALVNRGPYENPFPIDEEYFVVSRGGTVILRNYDGTRCVTLLRPQNGMGFYSPIPLRATPRPPVIPSTLPKKPEGPWGSIYMQDVYNGLEPYVKRGEVKQICVVQEMEKPVWAPMSSRAFGFQYPVVSCSATYAAKKIWGYAKVEMDGSAHFKVPSGVPIYFLALDREGRAIQRMRSFTHFQPGEKQGCIGCHANRNQIVSLPERRRGLASNYPPAPLIPPEWGARNFDYISIVQPVLDRHCVRCHNGRNHPKGVDLSGDRTEFFCVSYETLARKGSWTERDVMKPFFVGIKDPSKLVGKYVKWIPSLNGTEASIAMIEPRRWGSPASLLADLIVTGHPDKSGRPRIKMDMKGQRRIMAWMDLNVPYYYDSYSNTPRVRGARYAYPRSLNAVLGTVAKERCAGCHQGGRIPREFYTRITNVEENSFLHAPLAKSAGGSQKCSVAVFKDKNDPDYRRIVETFKPLSEALKKKPRLDMYGGDPRGDGIKPEAYTSY